MEKQSFHLAQLNIARMRAPLDDPLMEGFASRLEEINAVADRAEGFVWRLQAYDGNATVIRATADPLVIVNMSVWESVAALRAYVYSGPHRELFRRRAEWFERMEGPILVLWWIPRGALPRVEQGMARLKYLSRRGPSPWAFTIRECFPPPGESER